MELQALLVLSGICVIAVAVWVLLGLFSTSGTTYEEAIAQQRKATTELLALAESKNKPKKNIKKANKKLAKKERSKEANLVATGSEVESEVPGESGVDEDVVPAPSQAKLHVEFSPPVVVDATRVSANVKIRKRGKDPKIKPILLNKEDPSCITDPSTPPSPTGSTVSNHFEEIHPKDEIELLQSSLAAEKVPEKKEETVEKKENKLGKQSKSAKVLQKQPQPTEAREDGPRERHNGTDRDAPRDQRKAPKKDKKFQVEDVPALTEDVEVPVACPQPAEPLAEKVVKAAAPAPAAVPVPATTSPSLPAAKNRKKKPEPNVLSLMGEGGVHVSELVRVVRGAELSRAELQLLTAALLDTQHDARAHHSDWTEGPNDPMQKLKKQLADKEKALTDEMEASQALHAKLKELRASLNAERSRATTAARAGEQAAVAQRGELAQVRGELAQVRGELAALQARAHAMLDDNRALAQDKHKLEAKLSAQGEAHAQLLQMEMHIQRVTESEAALVAQLSALQTEAARAQQHAAELAHQLQEARLEQRSSADGAEEHLAAISELQEEVQRQTARAQAAEAAAERLRREGGELSAQVASLRERVAEMEALAPAAPTAHNGLPQHKGSALAEVEAVVESLRAELCAAQSDSRHQREQLERLQLQLAHYQDKNNELRTKNWKVMEALQSAEKALQSSRSRAAPAPSSLSEAIEKAQEAQYKEVARVLREVCPEAAQEAGSVVGEQWLRSYAGRLGRELRGARRAATAPAPGADELAARNEQLQALVGTYKAIIDDTEGALSRLQQQVAAEETRWAAQLADQRRELDELRRRAHADTQMQNKIESLQTELQQSRRGFADGERRAQERLMSGLSDKYNMNVSNGPLQVGLEEI